MNQSAEPYRGTLQKGVQWLTPRGPDDQNIQLRENIGFGHTRLSIIDPEQATQPMSDASQRYTLVYNGEIYNYQSLRNEMSKNGTSFSTNSDTEVVLKQYKSEGPQCLARFNGFFAFAVADHQQNELFLARDRMGQKPLYYYRDDDMFLFGSDLRALLEFPIARELDDTSLYQYLQLNYIPAPHTIVKGVKKLKPGHYLKVSEEAIHEESYYHLPTKEQLYTARHYQDWKQQLRELLGASVKDRLHADVPLGSFLSGGVDSSIMVALAAQHQPELNTFTIRFQDNPQFDESGYAERVAKKYNLSHQTIEVTTEEMLKQLPQILNGLDEPFADSSAIPYYLLCQKAQQQIKVALSGDGGDELFAGYNKYKAAQWAHQRHWKPALVRLLKPLWKGLPKGREGRWRNKIRQLDRFATGAPMSEPERYWLWATFMDESGAQRLLKRSFDRSGYQERKEYLLRSLGNNKLSHWLLTDLRMVLPNDMLHKVDRMSMANGLEVRTPFLDHRLVDFVTQLPIEAKFGKGQQKRILKDTFRDWVPSEMFDRPKQGFEVPLLQWFREDLHQEIEQKWLNEEFVREQGVFNINEVQAIKHRLHSRSPGDSPYDIWKLIVFQHWYQEHIGT